MHAILYTDGGSRGNPGKSACSFVLKDSSSKIIIAKGKFLGISTNNVAEYQGLIMGLENAIENKIKSLIFSIQFFLQKTCLNHLNIFV